MTDQETQSMAAATFKTADEIRQRLFDHRQFTSGEMAFIVRELETKRKYREFDCIEQSEKSVADIKDRLQRIQSLLTETSLSKLSDSTDAVIDKSHNVLKSGEEVERRCMQKEDERADRAKEMQLQFEDRVALGKNNLNLDLDQRITDLRQKLADIEKTVAPHVS